MFCEFMLIKEICFNWEGKKKKAVGKRERGLGKNVNVFYLDAFKVIWGDVSFKNILQFYLE